MNEKIILFKLNSIKVSKSLWGLWTLGILILLSMQAAVIFFANMPLNLNTRVAIFIGYIIFEFAYFILNNKISKKLYENKKIISSIFYQSIFLNLGMWLTVIIMPLFLVAYFRYPAFYIYYMCSMLSILLISIFYVKNIDPLDVVKLSVEYYYKKKKIRNVHTIFFSDDTLPLLFNKFPILVYMIYAAISFLALCAYFSRGSESGLYYLTLACMFFSSILLYSELCYILIGFKYLYRKKKNNT
ncbi:Uncharacterised protein [Neisseria zoodegmatis]|uniref:Uncharacterized protein n=1 Tax=Neisseria zoodegmatis TaxID=326523 RepID=A0A378WUG3_9NEIS|nr:hypothetical protein [Neisseria zoodegmatis]SUA44397.1 Uncharacterised protein [Neisseria zoodegmatis]